MRMPVRYLTALLLNVLLPLALMQAPSAHVHEHESNERHSAALFHTHLPHAAAPISGRAELHDFDPDDDARFLSWLSTSRLRFAVPPVFFSASNVAAPLPEGGEWRTVVLRPSAHAPPPLDATTPRAPPV